MYINRNIEFPGQFQQRINDWVAQPVPLVNWMDHDAEQSRLQRAFHFIRGTLTIPRVRRGHPYNAIRVLVGCRDEAVVTFPIVHRQAAVYAACHGAGHSNLSHQAK